MTNIDAQTFVACVRADDEFDLEIGKLYSVVAPEPNDGPDNVRVIDESDDDYLYPASWFVAVDVPVESARALHAARRSRSRAAG